jgi:hypothetical protein
MEKTVGGTISYTKKVGNVNVDQHWEYPGRDVDWLCTWQPCLKLYVLTILKELMTRTKEQRYESFKLYGTTAE